MEFRRSAVRQMARDPGMLLRFLRKADRTLSRTGRIDRLSEGLCKSSDFEAIGRRMAPFITSGCERLCRPQAAAKRNKAG